MRYPETETPLQVPDFRRRLDVALEILGQAPPDVMNHNLETVPRLYKAARPGADYTNSLQLLQAFKTKHPAVPTKSGLMVGLDETDAEILDVMRDLRTHRHADHRPIFTATPTSLAPETFRYPG